MALIAVTVGGMFCDGFFYKCAIWRYGEKEAGQANIFFNRDFKRLYLIKFNIDELSRVPVKAQ